MFKATKKQKGQHTDTGEGCQRIPRHSETTKLGELILPVTHVPQSPVAPPGSCWRTPCALPGSTITARKREVTISAELEHANASVFGGLVAVSSAARTSANKQQYFSTQLERDQRIRHGLPHRCRHILSAGNLAHSNHHTLARGERGKPCTGQACSRSHHADHRPHRSQRSPTVCKQAWAHRLQGGPQPD